MALVSIGLALAYAAAAAGVAQGVQHIKGFIEGHPWYEDPLGNIKGDLISFGTAAATQGIGAGLGAAGGASGVTSNLSAAGGNPAVAGAGAGDLGAAGTAVDAGAATPSGAVPPGTTGAPTADVARQGAQNAAPWHAPMALPESPMPPGPSVAGPGSSPLQFATHVAEIARPAPSIASQVIGGLGRSLAQGAVRSLPSIIHGDWKNAGAGIAGGLVNQGIGAVGNAVTSNLSGAAAPRFQIDVGGQTGMTGLDQQNMMIDRGPQFAPFRSAVDRVLGENPITTPSNPEPTNPYLMALTQGTSAMPTQILGNQAGSAVTRALSPPPTPPIAPLYGQPYYASLRRRIV